MGLVLFLCCYCLFRFGFCLLVYACTFISCISRGCEVFKWMVYGVLVYFIVFDLLP